MLVLCAIRSAVPEVVAAADFSSSTSKMTQYVQQTDAPSYLLLTRVQHGRQHHGRKIPKRRWSGSAASAALHMNEITLEDTLNALKNNEQIIEVPEEIRIRARRAVDRMLEIG